MKLETEGYCFDFPSALSLAKFDDPSVHGMSHCMKAVDVVAEFPDALLFIEIKAHEEHDIDLQEAGRKVLQDLRQSIVYKYRDSLLYQLCATSTAEEVMEKRLVYVCLFDWHDPQKLQSFRDKTQQSFPTAKRGCPANWYRSFVDEYYVVNEEVWNDPRGLRGIYGQIEKTSSKE